MVYIDPVLVPSLILSFIHLYNRSLLCARYCARPQDYNEEENRTLPSRFITGYAVKCEILLGLLTVAGRLTYF